MKCTISLTAVCCAFLAGFSGCGSDPSTAAGGIGGGSAAHGGAGGGTSTGTGGRSVGGSGGTTGAGMGGNSAGVGGAGGQAGVGGTGGIVMCVPGTQQIVITDCGYPYASATPLTSIAFNEADVLRAIQPGGTWPNGVVRLFYNDEHALTLGVRSVAVKTSGGTTTTDYPMSVLSTNPGSASSPQIGTTELAGDQSGLDPSLRPMWPSLFITDVTDDATSRTGDWQQGGRPRAPDAIFGTWKAAVRSIDKTVTPNKTSITPDADPAKNNWNLGGGDPVPAGLANEGFGAEVVWNVPLAPGRSYRVQVLVHDGDQNKAGGDSVEACVLFCAGGSCGSEGCGDSGGTGGSSGSSCPPSSAACGGSDGIDPGSCPAGTACANGCCLTIIP